MSLPSIMSIQSRRLDPRLLSRSIRLASVFAAASLVAACGGGGGGDSGGSGGDPFAGLTVPDAPSASATARLPSGLPAGRAAHCAELVSTDYRFVSPRRGSTLANMIGILEVDALQLEVDTPTGTTAWMPARRTCEFEDVGSGDQMVVSQSGVIVGTSVYTAPVIAFPMQSFDVPQLAGQWTALGQLNKGSGFVNVAADIAIADTGAVARLEVCEGVANCADPTHPTSSVLAKNADGGFDLSLPGWGNARLFAYQAGATGGVPGETMAVMVREDGSYLLMTRRRMRTLPTVTTDFQTNWNLVVSAQGVTQPLVETRVRIDTTTAPSTFTRTTNTPGQQDSRSETVTLNNPHTGYQHRAASASPSYPEWTLMPLRGMDFSVLAFTEDNRFMFSVAQPDIPSATVSLPSGLSKLASVAGCTALKNTPYRMVTAVNDAPTVDGVVGVLNFSNITPTGLRTHLDGTITQWTATGSHCEFSAALDARMIVAKSGVLIMLTPYTPPGGGGALSYRLNIGFPQSATAITLQELQGTWNALGFEVSSLTTTGYYVGTYTTLTLDEGGSVTALQYCEQDDPCVNAAAPIGLSLRANVDGGFDFGPITGAVDRVYAYRAGGGELMAVRVSADGGFSLLTRQRREVLPQVVPVTRQRWNVIVEGNLRTKELLQSAVSVTSVDTSNRSYVWSWQEGANIPLTETWFLNRDRDGYQRRNADNSQGLTAARRLDLRGMGLQLTIEPTLFNYDITVDRP